MSIEKRAAPHQGPSDLNKVFVVLHRDQEVSPTGKPCRVKFDTELF